MFWEILALEVCTEADLEENSIVDEVRCHKVKIFDSLLLLS